MPNSCSLIPCPNSFLFLLFLPPERGPVRGLKVSEETTDSFRVSWLPAPGGVLRYRLSYDPERGDSARLETVVPARDKSAVLRHLLPRTKYRVTATPEYESGDGPEGQTHGTTKEGESKPPEQTHVWGKSMSPTHV